MLLPTQLRRAAELRALSTVPVLLLCDRADGEAEMEIGGEGDFDLAEAAEMQAGDSAEEDEEGVAETKDEL